MATYGGWQNDTAAVTGFGIAAAVDATAISKDKQFKPTICATSAGYCRKSRTKKRSVDGTLKKRMTF